GLFRGGACTVQNSVQIDDLDWSLRRVDGGDVADAATLEPGEHRNSVRVRNCLCRLPGDAENESRGGAPVSRSSRAVHTGARHYFVLVAHVLASRRELGPSTRLAVAWAGDLRDLRPASQRRVEPWPCRRKSALISTRQRAKRAFASMPVTPDPRRVVR